MCNFCPADLTPILMVLFSSGESLDALKIGCFKYFERGGDCVAGPVGLLSGYFIFPFNAPDRFLIKISRVSPNFWTLFRHFFTVAFYSIWILFTHPRLVPGRTAVNGKPLYAVPSIGEYPTLFIMGIQAVRFPIRLWVNSMIDQITTFGPVCVNSFGPPHSFSYL